MRRGEIYISPELQELINETFGGEMVELDDAQDSEEGSSEEIGKSRYIQMSSIPNEVAAAANVDKCCPNGRKGTLFRETTV